MLCVFEIRGYSSQLIHRKHTRSAKGKTNRRCRHSWSMNLIPESVEASLPFLAFELLLSPSLLAFELLLSPSFLTLALLLSLNLLHKSFDVRGKIYPQRL